MSSNLTPWTEQTPSRVGMPMPGSTDGTTGISGASALADTRVRHAAGDARLVEGAFPGTTAWRPPNC